VRGIASVAFQGKEIFFEEIKKYSQKRSIRLTEPPEIPKKFRFIRRIFRNNATLDRGGSDEGRGAGRGRDRGDFGLVSGQGRA
jgi:hypothetical protein